MNVLASTVRRWDKTGEFKAKKHKSGHRYYDESDIRSLLNLSPLQDRKGFIYCRVSSSNQKDDLASQVKSMKSYCASNGIKIDELIKEIGGGMNFKRKKFLQLMDAVAKGEISKLLIAHKDRLSRFGFDYFSHVCQVNGCELMMEDLLAIVHTFSCRLYRLSSYKKTLKKVLANENNTEL